MGADGEDILRRTFLSLQRKHAALWANEEINRVITGNRTQYIMGGKKKLISQNNICATFQKVLEQAGVLKGITGKIKQLSPGNKSAHRGNIF